MLLRLTVDFLREGQPVHRVNQAYMVYYILYFIGLQPSDEVNPKLMQFFDADTLEEKYNILVSMRDEVDDHLINSMAVVLDVVIPEGPVADRYEQLKACIRTKQRYETQRMR